MCSELSLTWDEHRSTLVGVFERLLESSTLVDCTIAAEGQYLKAHKIILSACSPYFEMLFSQENEKNPIVVLKDIKFQELKALIDFIYRGKVKVPEERLGNFVDAAESLQIKGLGGGNQRRINPELTEKEYSLVEHNEEDHVSPRPRKRCRRSYANSDADKVTGISPVIDLNVNVETKTDEELQSRETRLEVPNSSEVDACPVLASLSESVTTFPSSECNEEENLEIKESSYVEEPTLSESEQLPNVDTVVVKSEPEAIAEVFLPEIDCFIEPKSEDLQETSLGSITGETEAVMGDSQPLSNQYSAFPPVLPSSSAPATVTTATAVAGRSDNLLLMGDVGGSFATQGADLVKSDRNEDAAGSQRSVDTGCPADGGSETVHRRVAVFIPEVPMDSLPREPLGCASNSALLTLADPLVPTSCSSSTVEAPVDPLLLTPSDMMKHFVTQVESARKPANSMSSRIDYPRVGTSRSNTHSEEEKKKMINRSSKNVFILPRPEASTVGANNAIHPINRSNPSVTLTDVTASVIVTQTSSLACNNALSHQVPTFHSIDNSNVSNNSLEIPNSNVFRASRSRAFTETIKTNWNELLNCRVERIIKSNPLDSSSSNNTKNSTMINSETLDPPKSLPTPSQRNNDTTERLLRVISSDYAEDESQVDDSNRNDKRLRHCDSNAKQSPQKRPLNNYTCDYCGMKFPSHPKLLRHMEIHSKLRPIRPKGVAQVVIAPSAKNLKSFSCLMCGAKFSHSLLLKKHLSSAHNSSLPDEKH